MQLILATSNPHKKTEIEAIFATTLPHIEIINFSEILSPFEIEENGTSFEQNATIKAKAVYEALLIARGEGEYLVLSEDSGLCVDALGGMPGIYSARFSFVEFGDNSWQSKSQHLHNLSLDERNLTRVVYELQSRDICESRAQFVANVCLMGHLGGRYIHQNFQGVCEGKVITTPQGNMGFGYDPIFVPKDYTQTLAQIETKNEISHRRRALVECGEYMEMCVRSLYRF